MEDPAPTPPAASPFATRGQRLRAARMKRFRSARKAARALYIPISTYGAHERAESPGGRDYGANEAELYAERFGVTPEWLLTGYRIPGEPGDIPHRPVKRKFPIVGYVGVEGQVFYYDIHPRSLDYVELPNLANPSTVALEILDSGLGRIYFRWFIFFDDLRQPVDPRLIGALCVVGLTDGRMPIKQLKHGAKEGTIDLVFPNQPTIHNASIAWAAKVKALVQPDPKLYRGIRGHRPGAASSPGPP